MDHILAWFDHNRVGMLAAIIVTVLILLAAWIGIRLTRGLLNNWLDRMAPVLDLSAQNITVLGRALNAMLWVLAFLLILGFWGIGVGGLWALLASISAVIGVGFFATWTMVSNITAFFFITTWRPFQLGDVVEVIPEGLKGRVINRNMMFVELAEEAGAMIQIPNNLIFQRMIRVTTGAKSALPQTGGRPAESA